jgi:hypothetical protein
MEKERHSRPSQESKPLWVWPPSQKLTLGLLAVIALEATPFCAYAPFLALLPCFKCILEVVFCEGVQYNLRFFLETLRIPYFLDNPITDGDEVAAVTRRLPFTARKIPGTHFY